jgi:hypothetical protein
MLRQRGSVHTTVTDKGGGILNLGICIPYYLHPDAMLASLGYTAIYGRLRSLECKEIACFSPKRSPSKGDIVRLSFVVVQPTASQDTAVTATR